MKRFFTVLLAGFFVLLGFQCTAQYTKKQIDSLYNLIDQSHDTKFCLRLGDVIYKASQKINYEKGMLKARAICGIKCYDVSHWEDAFRYATEGEGLAAKLHDIPNQTLLTIIKGTSYTYLGFYNEGKQTLLSALPLAGAITDPDVRHFRLGNTYFSLGLNNEMSGGNLKITLQYRQKSYDEQLKIGTKSKYFIRLSTAVVNMGDIYFKLKQYDSAMYYLNKAIKLAAKNDIYDLHARGLASIDLGDLCYQQQRFKESETYYQNALAVYTELRNGYHIRDICVGLSKVYIALNQSAKAKTYLDRSVQLTDSITKAEKAAIKTPLNYINKNSAQELSTNNSVYNRVIFVVFVLLILTFLSLGIYWYKFRPLNQAIPHGAALFIEQMAGGQTVSKSEELKEIVDLAIKNNPAFLIRYNEFDPAFSKKLLCMAPNLIAAEIEFCALLRLNFETKEIARYTKTSVRAVEGKKYRIRKKLSIPSDQDINIWMTNI